MTNLEWLKQNLTQETKELCSLCRGVYKTINGKYCDDENDYIKCEDCKLCKLEDFINFLSQEHKETIKLKQWEYDLIYSYKECRFISCSVAFRMKEKGYFKGIKDTSMKIKDILDNCIIVPDDYDFGGKSND